MSINFYVLNKHFLTFCFTWPSPMSYPTLHAVSSEVRSAAAVVPIVPVGRGYRPGPRRRSPLTSIPPPLLLPQHTHYYHHTHTHCQSAVRRIGFMICVSVINIRTTLFEKRHTHPNFTPAEILFSAFFEIHVLRS